LNEFAGNKQPSIMQIICDKPKIEEIQRKCHIFSRNSRILKGKAGFLDAAAMALLRPFWTSRPVLGAECRKKRTAKLGILFGYFPNPTYRSGIPA